MPQSRMLSATRVIRARTPSSRASVPLRPWRYLEATMLVAVMDQSEGTSTPFCSKIILPLKSWMMASRRSQVISSYGLTPGSVKRRGKLRPGAERREPTLGWAALPLAEGAAVWKGLCVVDIGGMLLRFWSGLRGRIWSDGERRRFGALRIGERRGTQCRGLREAGTGYICCGSCTGRSAAGRVPGVRSPGSVFPGRVRGCWLWIGCVADVKVPRPVGSVKRKAQDVVLPA